MRKVLIFIATVIGTGAVQAQEGPIPLAVFDLSFVNFSQEVEYGADNSAEFARIEMLSDYFRELLAESGRYDLTDLSPIAQDMALQGEVWSCNACEADLARATGAERSITGAVQKLSVLVQTIIIRERDVATDRIVSQYQTDIRGNTDIAWKRGLKWLVDHRLLAQGG